MARSDSSYEQTDSGTDESSSKTRKSKRKKVNYRRIDFRPEEEEQLIELVKDSPLLYSPINTEYKDRNLRGKAWDNIGKTLAKPSEDCKKNGKISKTSMIVREKKSQPDLQIRQIKINEWRFCHF